VGTKLYVGNLNYNTNEATLREAFGADGREVQSVSIIMDRETGRSRGFAFVEMATPEGAQAALAALDGQEVDGRMLRINEAREREARGAGGGGGSSYGTRPPGPGGGSYGRPPGPGGGYGSGPSGPGGPPSGGGGYAPRPAGPGGYRPPGAGGFPRPGGFGGPPSGGFGGPAPTGDRARRGKEKEKERDKPVDDKPKRGGRKRAIDDGDDW
jgi:RNA recognition motif-containing protein